MSLYVIVNNRNLPTYHHNNKIYIEGWKGSNYELQYKNNSLNRQKIVVSVDGLNIMSGDTNWEKGYVVDPGQTLNVPGWRKDSGNVAKFVFSSVGRSYNQHNEKGDQANIGVIGCKVFHEKKQQVVFNNITYSTPVITYPYWGYPYPHYPHYSPYFYPSSITRGNIGNGTIGLSGVSFAGGGHSEVTNSVNMAQAAGHPGVQASYTCDTDFSSMPQNSVGTGWGENKEFQTKTVNYEFDLNPVETILFYYDDRKGLQRRGIKLDRHYQEYNEPNAFPGDNDYCPPPVDNWR